MNILRAIEEERAIPSMESARDFRGLKMIDRW